MVKPAIEHTYWREGDYCVGRSSGRLYKITTARLERIMQLSCSYLFRPSLAGEDQK